MPWSKHKRAAHMLRQYHERMAQYRQWLGNVCVRCGDTTELEIDHIKEEWKQFRLAKGWTKHPWLVYAELMACQLLCKSCHYKKHY